MAKLTVCMMLALVLALVAMGCKSRPGSREFIPGQGWIEN